MLAAMLAPMLAAMLAASLAAQSGATQDNPPDPAEDVVVTARRPTGAPITDAVQQWQSLCFDAMRRTRRFREPTDDPDWQPLDAADRRRFSIIDNAVPAYGLVDPARQHTLLVKFERFDRPGRLTEDRCTLAVVGGDDHARMTAAVNRMFQTSGTTRHVGETDGSPSLVGWRQRIWTAMPTQGSSAWRGLAASGASRAGGSWIVVADRDLFFRRHDYVLADLKTRDGPGPALTMLTLAVMQQRK